MTPNNLHYMIEIRHLAKLLVAAFFIVFCSKGLSEQLDKVLFQQNVPRVPTHIMAEVDLAGRSFLMMLDTGAGLTVFDSSLKNFTGPELEERNLQMPGATDRVVKCYQGPPLKIGALSDDHPKVIVSDLKIVSRLTGRSCVGLLGINVMKRGKILLSYDDRIFKIHVGPWILDRGNFREVELDKESDIPQFNEIVLGHSINFTVDTGSNDCITLISPIFDALVDAGGIELSKLTARPASIGGMRPAKQGWFLKGELMGKSLAGVAVTSVPGHSMVGLQFLYAFNIEIDYSNRKLRYQLRADVKRPCCMQHMLGAILFFGEDGPFVEKLRPGGGAVENAGIRPGDVIVEFGALKGKEMNETTITETVSDEAGKEIHIRYLRKADGKQVAVQLKLPPVISLWDFGGRD